MPELNYDNEAVRQEVLKIAKYYIDLGDSIQKAFANVDDILKDLGLVYERASGI